MVERILAPGSILELAMRRCVLRKDIGCIFQINAKQSIHCGGPA